MEKKAPLVDVDPKENVVQSSSYRELELSASQKAFQDIVDVFENCRCVPKPDLSTQIKWVADEIVKSKIRDKLLLASKTDLNTKFSHMEIASNKQKEKKSELEKIRNQLEAQSNSIANQAKYIETLMEKVENHDEEVKALNEKVKALNEKLEIFRVEVATLRSDNVKLQERNDELQAQLNEMCQ